MADKVAYNDPTANNFPHDYNANDVDDRTALRTTSIRHKMYGKHVREAMAQGLEINSVVSGNADKNANDALDLATDTQKRFNNEIAGSENTSEVVDARHSAIKDKDYTVLSERMNDIEQDALINQGIINFTFDDSYRENRLTKQIFDEYGLICDFAIITDKVNNATNDYQGISWYLDALNQGYGIQSHSRTHRDLNVADLSDSVVNKEIVTSKQILQNLGMPVSGFVSPSSVTNSSYEKIVEQNYNYAVNHFAVNNINAPMTLATDRYHLQRMSLAAADIDVIKSAIDKTIEDKLLLMFYDHRTGYEGSATEEKLREVLDYVKAKVNAQQVRVLKSVDAIADFFKVNQVEPMPTRAKATELALPIARYLSNYDVDKTVWNVTAKGNPGFGFNQKDGYMYWSFDGNTSIDGTEVFQVIDLSKHVGELQPHYLSISAPINVSSEVSPYIEVSAFIRYFDASGNQLGNTEQQTFDVSGDKIIYNNTFGYPRDAQSVEIGYSMTSSTLLAGSINLYQPSILEDQVGYTGESLDVETVMQVGLTPDISKPLSWSFASLPSFTTGIARRYFNYDPNNNYITCIIAGTYEFRTLAAYKITGNNPSTNPRILLEMRVNDDNASHANALRRMQSSRAIDNIYNIDSSLKITLKTGDQVRFATDADMAGTPTMEAIANSFVIIRREV